MSRAWTSAERLTAIAHINKELIGLLSHVDRSTVEQVVEDSLDLTMLVDHLTRSPADFLNADGKVEGYL